MSTQFLFGPYWDDMIPDDPYSSGRLETSQLPWEDLCKFWPKTSLQSSSWHLSVFSFLPKPLKHSTRICFGFCNVWSVWLVARCFSPPATWRSLDFKKTSRSSPAWSPASSKQPLHRELASFLSRGTPTVWRACQPLKRAGPEKHGACQLSPERVEPEPYMRACQLHYAT